MGFTAITGARDKDTERGGFAESSPRSSAAPGTT